MIDRTAEQMAQVAVPEKGWISSMRQALSMSAEQVARRKGVTRNAVYQAERSELDGAVSIKQMENLAAAMGGKFIYAIVPDERIETLKYKQAMRIAHFEIKDIDGAQGWSADDRQDWIEDKAAELLHDMPSDFWDDL